MSVDTKGLIKNINSAREIYNIIVDLYDKDAIYDIHKYKYENDNSVIGKICFKDGADKRQLFVSEGNFSDGEYIDSIGESEGKFFYLSLGHWGNSVEIITNIVKYFGGYVDENDCDNIGYIKIPKDKTYNYSNYIKDKEKIIDILDDTIEESEKIKIANQILKHKNEFKEYLNNN